MSDFEDHYSDQEEKSGAVDARAHKRLLEAVGRLNKTQFIKKPTRNEPSLKRNEFHLVKTNAAGEEGIRPSKIKGASVSVPDLVKVLNKTSKHLSIGKELKSHERNKKVLDKPLEKPVFEKIQRSIGYEKARKKLNRWNAVITRNRATDHLSFPLNQDNSNLDIIDGPRKNYSHFRLKSDLEREMEALDPPRNETAADDDESPDNEEQTLSRAEMIARTKELRLLRIRESQKSAKARLQNKIKSKKFHKIMKKEKLKEQMKEFEILQKQDPEAALKKLEQLEKHRVEERALLRHKNTGTWAKNLQVRAKYDKEVRKELSQQLAISRELTQKHTDPDDEEEEDIAVEEPSLIASDPFNPWMKKSKSSAGIDGEVDSVGGYRKYWNERNENEDALKKYNADDVPKEENDENSDTNDKCEESAKCAPTPKAQLKRRTNEVVNGWLVEECATVPLPRKTGKQKKSIKISDNLDDLFDEAEEELRLKFNEKFIEFQNNDDDIGDGYRQLKKKRSNAGKLASDLSFKQTAKRPNIDEELVLNAGLEEEDQHIMDQLKKISSSHVDSKKSSSIGEVDNINPEKFIKVQPKHLRTALPDMEGDFDEAGRANAKRLTIAEAFEDDDIVADFEQDKEEERRKGEPTDIDLTLPGWGSWAGSGIINTKRKSKKLILKFPKEPERKEENKGHVIIVDESNKKLREHQVSSLPFPFASVKDYEASIRAPIGKDFVPALAHRLLIKPALTTKLGAIIEPMSDDILVQRPVAPKTKTEKRIAAVQNRVAKKGKII